MSPYYILVRKDLITPLHSWGNGRLQILNDTLNDKF